jgi:hypothetical protein
MTPVVEGVRHPGRSLSCRCHSRVPRSPRFPAWGVLRIRTARNPVPEPRQPVRASQSPPAPARTERPARLRRPLSPCRARAEPTGTKVAGVAGGPSPRPQSDTRPRPRSQRQGLRRRPRPGLAGAQRLWRGAKRQAHHRSREGQRHPPQPPPERGLRPPLCSRLQLPKHRGTQPHRQPAQLQALTGTSSLPATSAPSLPQ